MDEVLIMSVSVLAADLGSLKGDLAELADAGADWLHVDVMDGRFVPALSAGPPLVRALQANSTIPIDVHLMVEAPERFIADFGQAHAITVHAEATNHLAVVLQRIRSMGILAGVALNPATPVSVLEDALAYADLVLVLAVNPGFPQQTFIPQTPAKVGRVRAMLRDRDGQRVLVGVDGGVKQAHVSSLVEAGCRLLVSGSAVFAAGASVKANIASFRKAASETN